MLATQTRVLGVSPQFRPLTSIEEKALGMIEVYDFGKVRDRVLKDGAVSLEEVDDAIVEFRRFLALICLGNSGLAMMSGAVDEIWHAFILHTRDYADFCQQVRGRFIHHQPASESTPVPDSSKSAFVEAYHSTFGAIPAIWGKAADCDYAKCGFAGCSGDDGGGGSSNCSGTTNCQDPE